MARTVAGKREEDHATTLRVGDTTSPAAPGVDIGGGTINTYGNNRVDGNGADGAFSLPAIPES